MAPEKYVSALAPLCSLDVMIQINKNPHKLNMLKLIKFGPEMWVYIYDNILDN